jgi:hypothetical protein
LALTRLRVGARAAPEFRQSDGFCWKILTETPQGAGVAPAGREEGLPGAFGAAPNAGLKKPDDFSNKIDTLSKTAKRERIQLLTMAGSG